MRIIIPTLHSWTPYREAVQAAAADVVVGKFDLAAELLPVIHPL